MKSTYIIVAVIALGFILIYTTIFDWRRMFCCKNCSQFSDETISRRTEKQFETKTISNQQNKNESKNKEKESAVIYITKENIKKEIYQSDIPVILDIYSAVCPPCTKLSPIIEKLAHEYKNKYKFCKLNIDKNFMIANEYKVKSLPTLIFIKNNEIKGRSGFLRKDEIIEKISDYFE